MAANPSSEQKATAQQSRKITTYDLVIGILAIFSLVILIIPIIVQFPPSTVDTLNTLEKSLCVDFLLISYGAFSAHQTNGHIF